MGFIGANGAGKSTTIRILMGLVHQDARHGACSRPRHAGGPGCRQTRHRICIRRHAALRRGNAGLAHELSFARSIRAGTSLMPKACCKRFDLKPQQKIKGLSHGQRVKAALLLALGAASSPAGARRTDHRAGSCRAPEVLGELMAVLGDEERTILFSSHNTLDVEQISDQITFIDRGRIIDSDDKEIFLDRWRRLRLVLPNGAPLPHLPGVSTLEAAVAFPCSPPITLNPPWFRSAVTSEPQCKRWTR